MLTWCRSCVPWTSCARCWRRATRRRWGSSSPRPPAFPRVRHRTHPRHGPAPAEPTGGGYHTYVLQVLQSMFASLLHLGAPYPPLFHTISTTVPSPGRRVGHACRPPVYGCSSAAPDARPHALPAAPYAFNPAMVSTLMPGVHLTHPLPTGEALGGTLVYLLKWNEWGKSNKQAYDWRFCTLWTMPIKLNQNSI